MPRFPAKMINLRASICPKNQAFFFLPIASFIPDYSLSEGEQKTIHLLSTFKQDWMQSSWSGTLPFQDMLTACAHLSYACSLFSVCWSTGTFWSQSWAVQQLPCLNSLSPWLTWAVLTSELGWIAARGSRAGVQCCVLAAGCDVCAAMLWGWHGVQWLAHGSCCQIGSGLKQAVVAAAGGTAPWSVHTAWFSSKKCK